MGLRLRLFTKVYKIDNFHDKICTSLGLKSVVSPVVSIDPHPTHDGSDRAASISILTDDKSLESLLAAADTVAIDALTAYTFGPTVWMAKAKWKKYS